MRPGEALTAAHSDATPLCGLSNDAFIAGIRCGAAMKVTSTTCVLRNKFKEGEEGSLSLDGVVR